MKPINVLCIVLGEDLTYGGLMRIHVPYKYGESIVSPNLNSQFFIVKQSAQNGNGFHRFLAVLRKYHCAIRPLSERIRTFAAY